MLTLGEFQSEVMPFGALLTPKNPCSGDFGGNRELGEGENERQCHFLIIFTWNINVTIQRSIH